MSFCLYIKTRDLSLENDTKFVSQPAYVESWGFTLPCNIHVSLEHFRNEDLELVENRGTFNSLKTEAGIDIWVEGNWGKKQS